MKPRKPDRSVSKMDVLKDIRGLLSTTQERKDSTEARLEDEGGLRAETAWLEEEVRRYKGLVQKQLDEIDWSHFPFPAFLKPAYEGSSKGVRTRSRVGNIAELRSSTEKLLDVYRQPVLVEEFIDGEEVTVGLVGNAPTKIVGIMRVVPRKKTSYFVYSLEIKRDWENLVDYECPARLPDVVMDKIEKTALRVFNVLGCRDLGRMDMRVSREGEPYFLEINPLPGLNPRSSDFPIMARMMGISYNSLIASVFQAALERYPKCNLKCSSR